ncbi:techylectin-5A-like [Ornithodoros turicata]|uniref:techylectin-5A-like n=1 Tax=Ornithodoros turicata TaxID=34597 RepID=UPI00313A3690
MLDVTPALILLIVAGTSQCAPTLEEALTNVERSVAELKRIVVKGQPRDCGDLYFSGQNHSGVYNIYPYEDSTAAVSTYCDMESDGGGWTVFQRRGQFGNPVFYFYRKWADYAHGFGNPAEEYWLGNNVIHSLTSRKAMRLRIQLKNHTHETLIADYSLFKVSDEKEHFKITVSGYTGKQGSDSFSGTNGAMFSTQDQDHDTHSGNCAVMFKGAWWYTSCHSSNLNGLNLNGEHPTHANGIEWSHRDGATGLHYYSFPEVEMKIRDVSFTTSATVPL